MQANGKTARFSRKQLILTSLGLALLFLLSAFVLKSFSSRDSSQPVPSGIAQDQHPNDPIDSLHESYSSEEHHSETNSGSR